MTKNKFYLSCLFIGIIAWNSSYADSRWSSKGVVAMTSFKSGIEIAIAYSTESSCHKAFFGIIGSASIKSMRFFIDDNAFNQINPQEINISGMKKTYTGFKLSKNGLKSLKTGNKLKIESDIGNLTVSLTGSAKAFNQAWQYCEQSILKKNTMETSDNTMKTSVGSMEEEN